MRFCGEWFLSKCPWLLCTWQLPFSLRKTMCSSHFPRLFWILCSMPWSTYANSCQLLSTACELSCEVTWWPYGEKKRLFTRNSYTVDCFRLVNVVAMRFVTRSSAPACQNAVSCRDIYYNMMNRPRDKRLSFWKDLGWLGPFTQECKVSQAIAKKHRLSLKCYTLNMCY